MGNQALEEYLELIESEGYSVPACEIEFQAGEGKPWESKLGGCPYLRAQDDYPIGRNGKPMLFMAQINLKEIPGFLMLPDHGLLQFFVEQDSQYGGYSDPVVRYMEEFSESEGGLPAEHPFADEAYLALLPFEHPAKMIFADVEMTDEGAENSRVGGFPYFPQDGEFEPDEDFLLLQLSDDENIHFGDCGVCQFIISLEELADLDFSEVIYRWDCN